MSVLLVFIDESHKHTESSDIELPLFFVFVLLLNMYLYEKLSVPIQEKSKMCFLFTINGFMFALFILHRVAFCHRQTVMVREQTVRRQKPRVFTLLLMSPLI